MRSDIVPPAMRGAERRTESADIGTHIAASASVSQVAALDGP
jgi:hypothetical protein